MADNQIAPSISESTDDMYIWKQMSLEELEENLYALQIDYNPPLTEAQRETVLQKLEAFISHVKSITPGELEEQTKAKWRASRIELNTCCQDPVFAVNQEDNLLFSNSQIVFLKDTLEGKTVYHCILRGEELDYAIQEKKIPSIQKELTVEQLNYLTNEKNNNPYPKIEVNNLVDEVKARIFKQIQEYVPPVYKELLLKIDHDSRFMRYTTGDLYNFATDLSVDDYNLFLTDIEFNQQLVIAPNKTRNEYAKETLQLIYNDYKSKGKQRIYDLRVAISEFMTMLREKWNYAQLFIKEGSDHYRHGKELLWKPVAVKTITENGNKILRHSIVDRLGPKFDITFTNIGYIVSFFDVNGNMTKSTKYGLLDKKISSVTYFGPETRILKYYYSDGVIMKRNVHQGDKVVRSDMYNKKGDVVLTTEEQASLVKYIYYPIMKQMPITIEKSIMEDGTIAKNVYYRMIDEDGVEKRYLIERRIFNSDKDSYKLEFYDINGNQIPVDYINELQVIIQTPNVIEERSYTSEGNLSDVTETDLDGNKIKEIAYDELGFTTLIETYEGGYLSQRESINMLEGTIVTEKYTNTFYPSGKIKSITYYNKDGVKYMLDNYDEEDNIVSKEFYTNTGTKSFAEYYLNNDIYKQEFYYPNGGLHKVKYYLEEDNKIEYFNNNGSPEKVEYFYSDGSMKRIDVFNSQGFVEMITYYEEDGIRTYEHYIADGIADKMIDIYPNGDVREEILNEEGGPLEIIWKENNGNNITHTYFREDETMERNISYNKLESIVTKEYYGLEGEDQLQRKEYYKIKVRNLPGIGWTNVEVKYKTVYYDEDGNVERVETFKPEDTVPQPSTIAPWSASSSNM